MLLINARLRPCSALASASSPWRAINTSLFSTLAVVRRGKVQSSLPFGPSTDTFPFFTATFTLAGMATGILPIRDIKNSFLPNKGDEFAADILFPGFGAGHHSARSGYDGDAHAVQ